MLSVKDHEIRSLVSMSDVINCMEQSFSDFYDGLFTMPQRSTMEVEGGTVLSMPCYRKKGKYFTIKVVSVFQPSTKIQSKMIQSSIFIFNSKDGSLKACFDGDEITAMRTGAASGVATKFFAAPKSKSLAIFGTGAQAYTQVEAMMCVRPIGKIFVFSKNLKSSKTFSNSVSEILTVNATPGILKNLKEADIICTATPSKKELFNLSNLKEGVHINAIGSFKSDMIEISSDIIKNSKIIVDSVISSKKEAGDLIQAEKNSNWEYENIFAELGSITKNKKYHKEYIEQNSLFKSVGLGFQDLALTELLLKRIDK